jgi:hypothetical protein
MNSLSSESERSGGEVAKRKSDVMKHTSNIFLEFSLTALLNAFLLIALHTPFVKSNHHRKAIVAGKATVGISNSPLPLP